MTNPKVQEKLQAILDALPTKPGCYIMKDENGKVIYVGKAINLRNRVRSYFHASAQDNVKTRHLVQRIAQLEWIVVASELEALILEMNLIQTVSPCLQCAAEDDKRYPYINVHWQDDFPKVTVTRQILQDGARYLDHTPVFGLFIRL
jgi:excinuclease ABC subunit C